MRGAEFQHFLGIANITFNTFLAYIYYIYTNYLRQSYRIKGIVFNVIWPDHLAILADCLTFSCGGVLYTYINTAIQYSSCTITHGHLFEI